MKYYNAFLAFLLVLLCAPAATAAPVADYIFYFIGDGMGLGPSMAAQVYNKKILGNAEPLPMFRADYAGWLQTYSASDDVTDSAAAGTALATGFKTKNGMLGMLPDSTHVDAVSVVLQNKGYGIGIVTSVAADDATPGAFVAHVPSRKHYADIDRAIASSGFEFFAGAGLKGAYTDGKPNEIFDLFEQNNVQVVRAPGQLDSIVSRKVLAIGDFSRNTNIGYTIDSIAGIITLPMLTKACIEHLEKYSPGKFFAMIEGGNIDHALHANDGGASLKEIVNFNQAIALAMEFYEKHPDNTLIVITADHDTGGLAYQRNGNKMRFIDGQRLSKETFSNFCKSRQLSRERFDWDDMKKYIDDNLGLYSAIKLSKEQKKTIREAFKETFEEHEGTEQKTLYASFHPFAATVFKVFDEACGMGFTGTSHTANPVPLFVIGCGAGRFSGLMDNNQVAAKILEAAGVKK